jgi:hypothetical protein
LARHGNHTYNTSQQEDLEFEASLGYTVRFYLQKKTKTNTTTIKKSRFSQVLMPHACNPSYSGSRDQEDYSSKPAWANKSESLSQKYSTGWWSGRAPAYQV